jgi:hypothetical protein
MDKGKITLQQEVSNSTIVGFVVPLLGIVGILLLFVFLIPSTYTKIVSGIDSYKNEQELEAVLQNKITVLKSTPQTVLDKAPSTVIALPDKNPSLAVLSQVKILAEEKSVTISNIKTQSSTEAADGISEGKLSFRLSAPEYIQISEVLKELPSRAPLSSIYSVTMKGQSDADKVAEVSLMVYWSALPKNLPPLTEPLTAFTPEELALLDKLSALRRQDITDLQPDTSAARENPFN